jgi:Bifunctional DNA primase/polymerase, N-terminal
MASAADVEAWCEDHPGGNIALRLPKTVVGVDADSYKAPAEAAAWADLLQRFGPLPGNAPWCSSRDDDVSGVRLLAVPEDYRAVTDLGLAGEVIQHHHRYVVVPPSIHPDTGRPYRWVNAPDGVGAGPIDVTLFCDQSGTLIREIDTFPTFTFSFIAPSTGKSIGSVSPVVGITDYTGGGADGTAAVLRLTGLQFRLGPGVIFTGRQVFDAVVVDHSPEGIPDVMPTDLISQSGNFFSGDLVPVICAALSGP